MLKEKNKKRILLRIVFTVYLLILFRITVFRSNSYPTDYDVNLSLFTDLAATYHENGIWMVIYLVVGNIVWFVPFGFLLPMIWNKLKSYYTVPLGFCLSLAIELGQLFTAKGMFEIDDLVLNTLGASLGYAVYKTYRSLKK